MGKRHYLVQFLLMAISQQKLREVVFHLLYSYDFAQNAASEMIPFLMGYHAIPKKALYIAEEKKQAILAKLPEIDALISETSLAYEFSRISCIEKNILRLGVFELHFAEDIPHKVAIAEAIRLARKFSTPEGATFVNAILDVLYKKKLLQPAIC
ncbi:MAG: transcription antitermination factor NusB [Rhabdochlamydiaceae bacterium]|jgi:N utilization substance protein B